jgi:hypothetical protein
VGTIDTSYKPYDPLNLCSLCGDLARKTELRRLPGGLFGCNRPSCAGERTAVELDRANARQKPFRILPVPNARPERWNLPDSYEGDEGEILNFCERAVNGQCRYESVNGGTRAPLAGYMLPAFGWMGRYLFGMILENKRPLNMIEKATSLLTSIATLLMTRQVGFGLSPSSTRANSAFYGGFLETGSLQYVTEDTATCGMAMLCAYRVTSSLRYRDSARAAANYLRNVQAIGSNGTHFTSSDSAGTARLYTGGVASEVATAAGFYSDGLFYPGDLVTLEFWNVLLSTDGDQSIGATAAATGFDTTPEQLLSTSITDMREFWLNGVRDSALETYTGLSATTPREFFNAYPAVKPNFNTSGTGRWEYQDGDASTGTMVSAQNFAKAIASLYAYEGYSDQVSSVSLWLRSFVSNASYETGANQSMSQLARATTGEFDATATISTLLLVRDSSDSYSSIKKNGSSLYDWGAFGMLSSIWGAKNASSFTQSRTFPLGRNQRFFDGTRSDGDHFDWITLRGLSGLSYQTAFFTDTIDGNATTAYTSGSSAGVSPPGVGAGLVAWFKGDAGRTVSGGTTLTGWADQSGYGQDFTSDPGWEPQTNVATINGIPCMSMPFGSAAYLFRAGGLKDRNGVQMGYNTGETQSATVMAIFRVGETVFSFHGGVLLTFVGSSGPNFEALLDLESTHVPNGFWLFSRGWRNYAESIQGPDTTGTAYDGLTTTASWSSSGFPDIDVFVNGSQQTLTPATIPGVIGGAATPVAILGNSFRGGFGQGFVADIAELLVWDYKLSPAERTQAEQYIGTRSATTGAVNLAMVNDVVRASQFAQSFRINPNFPMSV